MKKTCMICLFFTCLFTASAATNLDDDTDVPLANCLITTKLDSQNNPLDDVQSISLTQNEVVVYTYWTNMRSKDYEYICRIYDQQRHQVYVSSMIMKVTTDRWSSRTTIFAREKVFEPGSYTIQIYLDGKPFIVKKLLVTDDSAKQLKVKNVGFGLGCDNILHSENGYFGGSYFYSAFDYRLNDYLSVGLRHEFAIAPYPFKEQMLVAMVTLYSGKIIDDIHFSVSGIYNNDLSSHDVGKVGGAVSLFDSAFEQADFNFALLPVGCIYDLDSKGYTIFIELLRMRARF